MTFSRQLVLFRAFVVLAVVASSVVVAASVVSWVGGERPAGGTVVSTSVLLVLVVFLGGFLWPMLAAQRPLAQRYQQLRQVAVQVPGGHMRFFTSVHSHAMVVVAPSRGRVHPDRFYLIDADAVDEVEAASPGDLAHLASTEVAISRAMPVSFRLVHVDRVLRAGSDTDQELTAVDGSERASLAATVRLLDLNRRTGILTPSREDLDALLSAVRTADRTYDYPLGHA